MVLSSRKETTVNLCPIGERLRARVYALSVRIKNNAWQRAGVAERREMLAVADAVNSANEDYQMAFSEWRNHYRDCKICREAMIP
jgi:hypothetical protein